MSSEKPVLWSAKTGFEICRTGFVIGKSRICDCKNRFYDRQKSVLKSGKTCFVIAKTGFVIGKTGFKIRKKRFWTEKPVFADPKTGSFIGKKTGFSLFHNRFSRPWNRCLAISASVFSTTILIKYEKKLSSCSCVIFYIVIIISTRVVFFERMTLFTRLLNQDLKQN